MKIAFIAARGGSKSIPLKNIKKFCGKPLIYWNLIALSKVNEIDKIYVATDSEEIKHTVLSFGIKKVEVFDRNKENAKDDSSTESVMLEFIEKKKLPDETLFILSQITCPLSVTEDYVKALNLFYQIKADSLLSCARVKKFFWTDNCNSFNYDYKNRPLRQNFSGILMENGAFYINSVGNIKRNSNRLSGNIAIYEMPEYTAVDIDEDDDWIIAEKQMRKHILGNRENRLFKIKLFVSDVDGVLTDAGMYYGETGEELKKFNTRDGKGFEILKNAGIKTAIITSEDTNIVARRAKKLKIDYLVQGCTTKLKALKDICHEIGISLDEVAYIGDDINDLEVIKEVGIAICPKDANDTNLEYADFICTKKGGEGCVREFIDHLLNKIG
jgi:YrbI family 3-deoxy-D-manno-octulosonate 8-phosphate phosphatase